MNEKPRQARSIRAQLLTAMREGNTPIATVSPVKACFPSDWESAARSYGIF